MSEVTRYVITSAQKGANVNKPLMSTLENYASRNDAEIIISPIAGSHIDDELSSEITGNYNVVEEIDFSPYISLRDFKIKPQQIRPLTGIGRFIQSHRSTIMGNPKQHLEVVPTSNFDTPKVLMTTGTCTRPNYRTQHRIGTIAQQDHTYGALVLEVLDNGMFQYRQLTALSDGSFNDINNRYTADGRMYEQRPECLIYGDIHAEVIDEEVLRVSLQLQKDLNPKKVILHDLFNGGSISHHNLNQLLYRASKSDRGDLSLNKELRITGEVLNEYYQALSNDSRIFVVKSNHDEHLNRYLEEGRFATDPENLYLASQLVQAQLEGNDPLKEGIELCYGEFGKYVKFLQRDEDLKIRGWRVDAHGDRGGNGSRGSITSQQLNYGKSVAGHSHSPGLFRGAVRVGTSTPTRLDYTWGAGSWMNTHAIIHKNGKVQLINILLGNYKF